MEWKEWLGILANIAEIITPIVTGVISYTLLQDRFSRWRGIRNIFGQIFFYKETKENGKIKMHSTFLINLTNKGRTDQKITAIQDDKGYFIKVLFQPNEDRKNGIILKRDESHSVSIEIKQDILNQFKNSNGLFLFDNGNKKKIVSKKELNKVLKAYNSSIHSSTN